METIFSWYNFPLKKKVKSNQKLKNVHFCDNAINYVFLGAFENLGAMFRRVVTQRDSMEQSRKQL